MNVKRIAVLGVAGGALAAWLASASTAGRPQIAPPAPRTASAVELRGAQLAAEIARLRERLHPTTTPQAGRNLFEFSRSPASAGRAHAETPSAPMPIDDPQPVFAPPPLTLVGIAEDSGPEGAVRTAIISGLGQLFFAKIGERVNERFQVTKISADAAELIEVDSNVSFTLALR
jgi:hypothetical protein